MGKKNKEINLGRALIRNRFGMNRTLKISNETHLHSIDVQDKFDLSLLNLQSITEENSFQEFFTTVEMVRKEFQAEKLNVKFSDSKKYINLSFKEKNNEPLKIPRRPKWDKLMSANELKIKERNEFSEWRKKLALLQEKNGFIITPYEKNINIWRQLWRVIERSDIIVQIVDARNPLLFRCEDLENYVKEINSNKVNIILINKADFLTKPQRQIWAKYFSKVNVQVAFFSAHLAIKKEYINNSPNNDISEDESDQESIYINNIEKNCKSNLHNKSNILNINDLILLFKSINIKQCHDNPITIGLVGFPNVGKSSIINALLMEKKVSVSATPGKTKHFQTLYLSKDFILCDCPGLVMPNIVHTKAEMILNGILPINQMQDHLPPIDLLRTLISKDSIEKLYGIVIPITTVIKDINQQPTAEEILNAHGCNRGFMTKHGQPDNARSARYILQDFVTGKLLHCTAPPNYSQNNFHSLTSNKEKYLSSAILFSETTRSINEKQLIIDDLNKNIFKNNTVDVHMKGKSIQLSDQSSTIGSMLNSNMKKPWKKNKNSVEKSHKKSRKMYAYLDKH